MKVAAANPAYSTLDTPENTEEKDTKEYSILNHEQDKKKRSEDKANKTSKPQGSTNNYSQLDVHVPVSLIPPGLESVYI